MPTVLDQLPHSAHVVVIRLRSLGDCVLTTPALNILKTARPDLKLAIIVEDRFSPIFEDNPDVDAILPPRLSAMAGSRPALTLNLHGGTRSMALTTASAARFRAGFAHHRGSCAYNVRIPRAQEILREDRKVHTAEHLASAVFFLGAPRQPIPRARLFAAYRPTPRPYAVLHPVAAAPEKTWPAERFLSLAKHLLAQGLDPVFIAGAADDLTPFVEFRTVVGAPLKDVMSLVRGAALFVGNDSGPAHIAAAFGVPVVVLFGPSDPVVWAPWRTDAEVLVSPSAIEAIPLEQAMRAVDHLRVAQ